MPTQVVPVVPDGCEIVENNLEPKIATPGYLCEDMLVSTPGFIAVIDGVTNVTGGTYNGLSGGRFAAEAVAQGVQQLPASADCFAVVRALSDHLKACLDAAAIEDTGQDPPSAGIVIFSAAKRQVWRVGDLHLAVNGRIVRGGKEIDRVCAAARAAYLQACLREGQTVQQLQEDDPGRALIRPIITKQHVFRNKMAALGYGAIDGSDVPRKYMESFDVPDGPAEVVLASDGYFAPAPTLVQAERNLRSALEEDPLLIGAYKSTKGLVPGSQSYDDRLYVRIIIN